jgi:hypothetical protein
MLCTTQWRHMGEWGQSSVHFLPRQIFTFLPPRPDRPSLLLNTIDAGCSFTRGRAIRLWNRALTCTSFVNYNAVNMLVEVSRSSIFQRLHRAHETLLNSKVMSGDNMCHWVLPGSMLTDPGIEVLHVVDCDFYSPTSAVLSCYAAKLCNPFSTSPSTKAFKIKSVRTWRCVIIFSSAKHG